MRRVVVCYQKWNRLKLSEKETCAAAGVYDHATLPGQMYINQIGPRATAIYAKLSGLDQGSATTGPRSGAGPWRTCYWGVWNHGQIGPKVTGTTDTMNTLWVPLTTITPTGQSTFLRQNKSRSLTESVPWWLPSCNKFACAKHSLFYSGPVRKPMPGWNRSALRKRLPTLGLENSLATHGRLAITFKNRNACFTIWHFPWATKPQFLGQFWAAGHGFHTTVLQSYEIWKYFWLKFSQKWQHGLWKAVQQFPK